jgi:iron complex outermembrane receptor protein
MLFVKPMRIIFAAALLCFTIAATGQTDTFRLKVVSAINNAPIPDVVAICPACNLSSVSDQNGDIAFANFPEGKNAIDLSHPSFETKRINAFCCKDTSIQTIVMQPAVASELLLKSVDVEGTLAKRKDPVTFTEIKPKEIRALSNGQDMPQLLRFTPSLISTSDAGNGIGYTGLWIRGSDQSRINVSINGIPLNDPESQQVFWVNTPDFGSSANNIQIQRGIGTSVNGAASFGGSIQIETRGVSNTPYAETNHSIGSFNSMRNNLAFGTGLIGDHFVVEGRLSRITSDGYIDRASSDLQSFFLESSYIRENTTVRATVFGGQEVTYQSWAGTPAELLSGNADSIRAFAARNDYSDAQLQNLLQSGRTYNFYEYDNQVDDYKQNHAQLHLRHQAGKMIFQASTNYTHGRGFFEEFKEGEDFSSYGLAPIVFDSTTTISTTDLVRRRWLKNHFYGGTASATLNGSKFESTLGMAMHQYRGDHFGEIIWMQYAGPYNKDSEYYRGESVKTDGNVYLRTHINVTEKLRAYTDIQFRHVDYTTQGIDNDLQAYNVDRKMNFLNPKAGLTYSLDGNQDVYASVAYAGKEPNRNDFIDAEDPSKVKPEYMTDVEAGYRLQSKIFRAGVNGYYMQYRDQLVLTGELNDVGAPLRTNVASSFRRGLEFELATNSTRGLTFAFNATLSQNKITAFEETLYDYTSGFDVVRIQHNNTDISFSPSVSGAGMIGYILRSDRHENTLELAWYSKYVGRQYLDNTQNDYMSIDPYFVQDFRITGHIQKKIGFDVNLWINNVLNTTYSANGYTYSYIFESRVTERFYYPQAGRAVMVGIGVRL